MSLQEGEGTAEERRGEDGMERRRERKTEEEEDGEDGISCV
jgi:hypothetical protein